MYTMTGLDPKDGKPIEITVRDGIIHAMNAGRGHEEQWLSRGFVDLQVNGYGGDDVNMDEPDSHAIISLTAKMIAAGVTTYLPTITTASEGKITAALRAIASARQSSKLVAGCVPCVHVEGPHISPLEGYRGAHPVEHVRPPDLAEFARWQQALGGLVGMVTLLPHFEDPMPTFQDWWLSGCMSPSGIPMLTLKRSARRWTPAQDSRRIWEMACQA